MTEQNEKTSVETIIAQQDILRDKIKDSVKEYFSATGLHPEIIVNVKHTSLVYDSFMGVDVEINQSINSTY